MRQALQDGVHETGVAQVLEAGALVFYCLFGLEEKEREEERKRCEFRGFSLFFRRFFSLSSSAVLSSIPILTGFSGSVHRICSDAEGKSSRDGEGEEEDGAALAFFSFLSFFFFFTAAVAAATAVTAAACLPSFFFIIASAADCSLAMASALLSSCGCFGAGTSSLTMGTPCAGGGEASLLRAGTNWSRLKEF